MSYEVNQRAWDTLSTEYKAVFEVAAQASARRMLYYYDAKNPGALERLIAGGTQMRSFSNDIMTLARTTIGEILEEYSAADQQYREVYDTLAQLQGGVLPLVRHQRAEVRELRVRG